jgi:type IV pilus assembly protein PilN
VSASNRFDFDLLAEYNPPSPNESRPAGNSKKPAASGGEDSETSPADSPQGSGFSQRRVRPPYTGPPLKPNPKSNPNPGGPQ